MNSKLSIEERGFKVRLHWWIEEDADIGGAVGDAVFTRKDLEKETDRETREFMLASIVAAESDSNIQRDVEGYFWETASAANKVRTKIKAAWKQDQSDTPWPEWAVQAAAAGWKAPKGWAP